MKQSLTLAVLMFAAHAQAFTFHVAPQSYLNQSFQKSISDYVSSHCRSVLSLEENTTSRYFEGVSFTYVSTIDFTFENNSNFDRVEITLDQKGTVIGFDGETENCTDL